MIRIAALFALCASACSSGDTFVLVDVERSGALDGVRSLEVDLALGDKHAHATFPSASDVTFPTTASLRVHGGVGETLARPSVGLI